MILASFLDCLSDFFFYENKCHGNASVIVGEMIADGVFKSKASIANQTLKSLFDFLYDVTVFLLFSVWKKKKRSRNFISWDFIWFQESVENESSLTWGFVIALRESFLLCGSVPPLCSLILSPGVQR